jgi:hypothetical protein
MGDDTPPDVELGIGDVVQVQVRACKSFNSHSVHRWKTTNLRRRAVHPAQWWRPS